MARSSLLLNFTKKILIKWNENSEIGHIRLSDVYKTHQHTHNFQKNDFYKRCTGQQVNQSLESNCRVDTKCWGSTCTTSLLT